MSKELDDLNGAVTIIGIAVGDASSALKDIAAKLAAQSSTNPGDVEAAANKLLSIAKGLDDVVTAAGEPITTAGNDTVSAAAGNDTVSGGTGEQPIDPATETASQSAPEVTQGADTLTAGAA